MGKLDRDRNIYQYNVGGINCFVSSYEGSLTFGESYEENLVSDQSSSGHPDGILEYLENLVTIYKDIQGVIALVVYPQMRPRTKPIVINYHHFRTLVANGDVEIKHVDTKE